MKKRFAYLGVLCVVVLAVFQAFGQSQPDVPATRLKTRFSGLSAPIFLTHAGDGSKRIFIVERAGVIRVAQPGTQFGQPRTTVFLNISSLTSTDGERGLLGLAFHPQYEENRRFFVYYTKLDGDLQISEFQANPANPDVALTTEKPILTIEHSQNSNHNGGTIAFGPDGYLYAAPGDGGAGNDPPNNAQNINSLLGKVLRIDVNVPAGQNVPYLIPPTNPFAGDTPGADEIFAVGMRNPFRWSFDRGGTRQLWAGDVGQGSWEEVDIIVNGGNYGWRIFEGNTCTNLDPCNPPTNYVPPVFVYSSQQPGTARCSITGGYVYRGSQGTLPDGSYIYGDYCTGEILLWHEGQQIPLHDIADFNLVSFGEDEDGELYVVHALAGIIQKIVPTKRVNSDFDGDRRTDLAIFRPGNDTWYLLNANTGVVNVRPFNIPGEPMPAAADYDGDGITDFATFVPFGGSWRWVNSSNGTLGGYGFGNPGDIPMPGDYDGDGRADLVVFRPSEGAWYLRLTTSNFFSRFDWGAAGDVPVSGDFDGDGRYDVAVWRPSNGNWYVIHSSNGAISVTQWGVPNDIPAPGDFDGDGRTDFVIFRPSTGLWYQRLSATNTLRSVSWGVAGDVPVVGDYDGDGLDDVAVWRPSTGTWYIVQSTGGILRINGWGVPGDIPVPSQDAP